MYGVELRIKRAERLAQRTVECVHWAVAVGSGVETLPRYLYAHRCLGTTRGTFTLLHDHGEINDGEWGDVSGAMALHEQLEGCLGTLVACAGRLHLLNKR